MKRIASIIGTVLVVGSVACSAAGAATAPSVDYVGVRDAASEEDLNGKGQQDNALSVADQLFDDELAAPRIMSAVPVNTDDEDDLYATRGRDFDRIVSRDAASEDDLDAGVRNVSLGTLNDLDDEMAAPRIASSLPVDTSDDDELYVTRGRDFDRIVSRDAASEEANL